MVMFFLYYYYRSTQTNGAIHGEKAMGVGSDGTRRMISLHSIYIHRFYLVNDEDERTKFLIIPACSQRLHHLLVISESS